MEKNERITKRKLFELQKKFTALQKATAKQARSGRGKLSRNNTMTKSTNQMLLSQISVAETETPIDDAAMDDYFEAQEKPPCTNCPILQQQLDSYKQKIKLLKSTDSFDRFSAFDRNDTGLSDMSLLSVQSRGNSKAGSRVGTPEASGQDTRQAPDQDEEPNRGKGVVEQQQQQQEQQEQQQEQQRECDSVPHVEVESQSSVPLIVTETPHVPAFDDHSHTDVLASVPQEIVQQTLIEETISVVTDVETTFNGKAGEENEREESEKDGPEQEQEECDEEGDGGITFINNCEDVTSQVLDSEISDDQVSERGEEVVAVPRDAPVEQAPAAGEDPSSVIGVARSHSRDLALAESNDDASVELELPETIAVTQAYVSDRPKSDDLSVHSTQSQTSIVANITAVMTPTDRQHPHELHSLEMSAMDEDVSKETEKKPRKKSVSKHHKHHHQQHHHQQHHHQQQHHHHHKHKQQHKQHESKTDHTHDAQQHQQKQKHQQKHPRTEQAAAVSPRPGSTSAPDDLTLSPMEPLPLSLDMSSRMSSILHSSQSISSVNEKMESSFNGDNHSVSVR